jgi:hypothetical protein
MVGGDMEGDAVSEVHLLQGDCVEVMKTLESDSVGLFVFSPPYNCRKPYTTFKDEMPWDVYYLWMEDVLSECYRIMEKGGVIAVNVPTVIRWQAVHEYASSWSDYDPDYKSHRDGKQVLGKGRIEPIGIRLFGMMEAMGLKMREPIVWVKGSEGNAICSDYRMGCDSDPYMRPAHELILLGSKGSIVAELAGVGVRLCPSWITQKTFGTFPPISQRSTPRHSLKNYLLGLSNYLPMQKTR